MWKKIGFSSTHGARARIIRRCAKPRRSLQSEGTRRRWTLQSHVQLSMEVQHHKHVCLRFVTCKRISTGFQAVGLSTRPVLLRKLAFLHRTLFSCLLSTNPPEIDTNTTKECHHPCRVRLVGLHVEPVPSTSHVKPARMCKTRRHQGVILSCAFWYLQPCCNPEGAHSASTASS